MEHDDSIRRFRIPLDSTVGSLQIKIVILGGPQEAGELKCIAKLNEADQQPRNSWSHGAPTVIANSVSDAPGTSVVDLPVLAIDGSIATCELTVQQLGGSGWVDTRIECWFIEHYVGPASGQASYRRAARIRG